MVDQLQTARRHTDNSRECSCSSSTQLSTLNFSTTQPPASHAETRSAFYVFIKESEHIGLPLRDRKIKKVVSVLRCSTNRRIDFQDVRFAQTAKFVGQLLTGRSAVIVCRLNQHDRSRCLFRRNSEPFAQFDRTLP